MKKNIFANNNNFEFKTIFKDETVFYQDYFPENIFARDVEIKELSSALQAIVKNKRASNLLINGPPGTGKTLVVNYVLKELISFSPKAKTIYINAIQDNTKLAIMSKLGNLFNVMLPRRGLASDEVFQRILEELKKCEFIPIIVIDEIDKLNSIQASNLLYDLSRQAINNKYFELILISNTKDFFLNLDNRVKSSLFLNTIEFNRYTSANLKEILKERIDYGLAANAISSDLIGYIAGFAAKNNGDARIAIDLLFKAAKNAEKKGSDKISKEILLDSAKLIDSVKLIEKINYLSAKEIEFLKSLKNGIFVNKLYETSNLSERTIRMYLANFENIGLIRSELIDLNKGKSRKIDLTFDKDLLK
ncbi:MAG: AAA family ATPase [archaeon]